MRERAFIKSLILFFKDLIKLIEFFKIFYYFKLILSFIKSLILSFRVLIKYYLIQIINFL